MSSRFERLEAHTAFDGAIVDGNVSGPNIRIPTIVKQNNPVITGLYREHGKSVCFAGVVLMRGMNTFGENVMRAPWCSSRQAAARAISSGSGASSSEVMPTGESTVAAMFGRLPAGRTRVAG